jgi:hypothetical protein
MFALLVSENFRETGPKAPWLTSPATKSYIGEGRQGSVNLDTYAV